MQAEIDGARITTRGELHDELARQLGLPEHYGRNLDALFDCLTDLHGDCAVSIRHAGALFAHLGVYADVFQAVLRDAAGENPHLRLIIEEE